MRKIEHSTATWIVKGARLGHYDGYRPFGLIIVGLPGLCQGSSCRRYDVAPPLLGARLSDFLGRLCPRPSCGRLCDRKPQKRNEHKYSPLDRHTQRKMRAHLYLQIFDPRTT